MTRYKVLKDGRSAHGGDLVWSLPTDNGDGTWTPGEWHAVTAPVVVCQTGLHLTTDPMQWPVVGMGVYEAEGAGLSDTQGDKTAFAQARLLRPVPGLVPGWWQAGERFITEEIPAVPWFQPDGQPDPAWRLFTAPTWDAAGDAALYTETTHICGDRAIEQRHRDHVTARWNVWRKGYGLCCDVNGTLYVYAAEEVPR